MSNKKKEEKREFITFLSSEEREIVMKGLEDLGANIFKKSSFGNWKLKFKGKNEKEKETEGDIFGFGACEKPYDLKEFLNVVDGCGPWMIVIRTDRNNVIIGFSSVEYKRNYGTYSDKNAFLAGIVEKKFLVLPVKRDRYLDAIFCSDKYFCAFGAAHPNYHCLVVGQNPNISSGSYFHVEKNSSFENSEHPYILNSNVIVKELEFYAYETIDHQ